MSGPSVFLPFCGKADRIVERAGFRKRPTQSSKLPSTRFTLRQNGLMPRLLLKKSSCSALRVGSKTHLMPIPFGKGSPLFLIASNWRNAREERPRLRSTSLLRATSPGADHPLAVAQIDHTPMDVIVVDEEHRQPIQRPSLTVVIDVYSRMVLGFAIYLEKPSAFTAGLAIAHAVLSK